MRGVILLAVAAIMATTSALAQAPKSKAPTTKVEAGEWIFLDVAKDRSAVYFSRPAKTAVGDPPRQWVRVESETPEISQGRSWMGIVTLYELDCSGDRYRALSRTAYEKRNLSGDVTPLSIVGGWDYVIPDSIGQSILDRACGRDGRP